MTTFWQESFSCKAHFAHIPSPVNVSFSPFSSARNNPTPEKSTPTAASVNSFRIVDLHERNQFSTHALETRGSVRRPVPGTHIEPPSRSQNNHFLRNFPCRPKLGWRGGCSPTRGRL